MTPTTAAAALADPTITPAISDLVNCLGSEAVELGVGGIAVVEPVALEPSVVEVSVVDIGIVLVGVCGEEPRRRVETIAVSWIELAATGSRIDLT